MIQTSWGGLIAWYLFLAGTGAAIYLIGSLTSILTKTDDNVLELIGSTWGPPLAAFGALLLLLDLGQPEKFLYAILRPFSSMISVGFILLTLFILTGFYHLFLLKKATSPVDRRLKIFGSVFAFGTAIYTGLLLGVVKPIPFWNNPLLPLLFLISALSAGAGLSLIALSTIRKWKSSSKQARTLNYLACLDLALLVLELLSLFSLLFISLQSGAAMADGALVLINGHFALAFWILVILVGILVPLSLEIFLERKQAGNLTIASDTSTVQFETATILEKPANAHFLIGVCLLIGGIALRYAILAAGVRLPIGF